MSREYKPYNPLDKVHLGESVAEALLRSELHPLGEIERFKGAGVYAIYYSGAFPAYAQIVAKGVPIYVGKAVPPGARQGGLGLDADPGPALYNRIREHAESIRAAAETLDINDFQCRFLVVEDIWIPLGESLLIARFNPVWNKHLDGFGNHDPGSGRYKGLCTRWDTVHPGRGWAVKCAPRPESREQIIADLTSFIESMG